MIIIFFKLCFCALIMKFKNLVYKWPNLYIFFHIRSVKKKTHESKFLCIYTKIIQNEQKYFEMIIFFRFMTNRNNFHVSAA